MRPEELPAEFLDRLEAVRGKRARIVVEHILKHGSVTTDELKTVYGYDHPPRAVRDVREQGIPIVTSVVEGQGGRRIAAYSFGDPSDVRSGAFDGRSVLPKDLKDGLLAESGGRCAVCSCVFEGRYLQTDHRVPYEVAGAEAEAEPHPSDYMLLCGSCNRAKSWSCEHCPNAQRERSTAVCRACYWASPEAYAHIALREVRRLALTWSGDEVETFERLRAAAKAADEPVPDYVKSVIRRHLRRR